MEYREFVPRLLLLWRWVEKCMRGTRGFIPWRGLRCCMFFFVSFAYANLQAQSPSGIAAVRVATGLTQPLFVTAPPGDFGRLFIVQQNGIIRILDLATGAV